MLAAEKKKRYTIDDYLLLEEGAPFQLIENDLVMSPSPIPLHQFISGRLFVTISLFLDQTKNKGVAMYAPMDVYFDDGNTFQPDLLFIAENRKDIIENRVNGAPDMVIEILSPSNAYYDLRQKKDIYEKYGVKEYIIIDPIEESAELYVIENAVYKLHQKAYKNDTLASLILPGLNFGLTKIFS
jgi:Uma2 family endonuclease